MECARTGGNATAILNGANEAAVGLFLAGEIGFLTFRGWWSGRWQRVPVTESLTVRYFAADQAARICANE